MTDLTKLSDEDLVYKHRSTCFGFMVEKISENQLREVEQELIRRLAYLRELETEILKISKALIKNDSIQKLLEPLCKT
jgi:hypothetical protein